MKRVTIDPRYHDAVIFVLDDFVADIAALHAASVERHSVWDWPRHRGLGTHVAHQDRAVRTGLQPEEGRGD